MSEIEKLEARWAENPEGRYFAPLADAYRKAGRLDDALQRIQQGLEKHPEYVSAYIVLGRIHLDKKDDPSARSTFEKVLGLDSENIIALKSLAEISERMEAPLDARKWLQQLLVIDPTNIDAESDLRRLGGPLPEAAAPETPADVPSEYRFDEPETVPPPSVTEARTASIPAIGIDPGALPGESSDGADVAAVADIQPFDDSLQWGAGERTSRAVHAEDIAAAEAAVPETAAAIDFLEPVTASPSASDTATVEMTPISMESLAPPADEPSGSVWDGAPEVASVDLDGGSASHASELEPTAIADMTVDFDSPAMAASGPAGDLPLIMPEDVTPPEEMSRPSVKMAALVLPEPAAADGAPEAPLITETMGDLYLKQGFRAEAADVYRELLRLRPGDASLLAKLAALEAPVPSMAASALGAEPVGSWLRRVARAGLAAPAPAPADAGAGASPLEQAFGGEAEAADEPAGEPARPGSDSYSLDRVFGAEGTPEAVPAAAPAPGGSFDEFFGSAPPPEPAPRAEQGAAPAGEDDLGSFNAWLHGLKK